MSRGPGEQVIVLADEYPSNYYTWQRFCLRTGAELVVVHREVGASWSEGFSPRSAIARGGCGPERPLDRWRPDRPGTVVAAARRVGAAVVIDASQSLGALPLDVARLRPDFVVSVGYKWLLGPFGVGCLYVDERHRDGEPLEENWINRAGSDDFSALATTPTSTAPGRDDSMSVSVRTSVWYQWRSPQPSSYSSGRSRASQRACVPSPTGSRNAPRISTWQSPARANAART